MHRITKHMQLQTAASGCNALTALSIVLHDHLLSLPYQWLTFAWRSTALMLRQTEFHPSRSFALLGPLEPVSLMHRTPHNRHWPPY